MISISCDHPDLEEFIEIKNDLTKVTKANISIRINKEFMDAVKNDTEYELKHIRKDTGQVISKLVNAKSIFNTICKNNWNMAEPGFLMWDRIKSWNLLSEDSNFEFAGCNPCAKSLAQVKNWVKSVKSSIQ